MEISAHTTLQTEFGPFNMAVFVDAKGREHAALAMGNISTDEPVLTRIHSECITGEVFHSVHCDCGQQLDTTLKKISDNARGLLIYLRQEGRDIGLTNKIKAYELQRQGLNTIEANLQLGFPADARHYGVAQEILHELGVKKIRLLTNNPDKITQLQNLGIEIVERVPLEIAPNGFDNDYLQVKKDKMGHLLTQV